MMKKRKINKLHKIWKNPTKWVMFGLVIGAVLATVGSIGAFNGWFGGGNSIPSDTLTRGLTGYWSFDEGSGGQAFDASNYSNHGVLTSGPTWGGSTTTCKVGGCLSFDGTNDYVNVGPGAGDSLNISTSTGFTMMAWVKQISAKAVGGVMGKYNQDPVYYVMRVDSSAPYIEVNDGVVGIDAVTSPDTINNNQWYFVAGTFYNGTLILYVDGVKKGDKTGIGALVSRTSDDFVIGRAHSSQLFEGLIDEVKIYNRALSAEEIRYHYNRGGPVGQWKFDEGEGRTAYDSTDNNNDGTLNLAPAGNTATSTAWVSGKYGSALSFDGTDDYVSVPDSASLAITNAITIELWLKTSGTAGGEIFNKTANANNSFRFFVGGNNQISVYSIKGGAGEFRIDSSNNPFTANTWRHLTYVGSGSNFWVYLDGQSIGMTLGAGSLHSVDLNFAATSYIGIRNNLTNPFNGLTDDVRIYNYVRTPEEIRLDYNSGYAALFGPKSDCNRDPGSCMAQGLVGYWGFEDGSGGQAFDASNYSNHGTLTGGPSWGRSTTTCKIGGCLAFDGTNDFVDAGTDTELNNLTAGSWEMWVNSGANDAVNDQDFFNGGYWNSPYGPMFYVSAGANNFNLSLRFTDGSVSGPTYGFTPNQWYHIVVTYDGNAIKSYVNGVFNSEAVPGAKTISHSDVNLGGGTAGRYWNGLLDEVKIYNRAMSPDEVRYHYNRGGPVAQWKFDEGEGRTAYDGTGNSNHGTLNLAPSGNTATSSAWVAGKYGSALSFDGVDDYVLSANSETDLTTFTAEAWIKHDNVPFGGGIQVIVSHGASPTDNGWSFEIPSSQNRLRLTFHGTGNYDSPLNILTNGVWQHVAVTLQGTTATFYLDGKLAGITKTGAMTTATHKYGIGATPGGTNPFSGLIDDARVYNYARTPEEIRLDYNSGYAALFGPKSDCNRDPGSCMTQGLVGSWGFEEGSGGQAFDASNYSNHGVLTSGPTWGGSTTTCKVGGCLSFDGVNDYVDAGNAASLNITGDLTTEVWFKASSIGKFHSLVSKGVDLAYNFRIRDTNVIQFYVEQSTGVLKTVQTTDTISANVWYHLVGVAKAGETTKIYINGVLNKEGEVHTDTKTTAVNLRLGLRSADGFGPTEGLIDEVKIYNRALSAEEIRYHYNRGGPVGQWKFDEGEGRTAYDSTDNNNDGTLILAGSATSSSWVAGKYGGALSFDGVNDYVETPITSAAYTAATQEAWIKSDPSGGQGRIVSKGGGRFSLQKYSANTIIWQLTTAGGDLGANLSASFQENVWTHVAATYDGSTAKLYINGELRKSLGGVSGAIVDVGDKITIGADNGSGIAFAGLIDDARVYNYARTPEQILQDYNGGMGIRFR